MTDEKKKGSKRAKSEPDEIQDSHKDTQDASSSGQQSVRSKKSARSLFRTLSAEPTSSETDNSSKFTAESRSESPSVQAATNALSVTARWGLNRQSHNRRPSNDKCNLAVATSHVTESKNYGKIGRSDNRSVKLYESLDARVLRDALVSRKDSEIITVSDSSQPNTGSDDAARDQHLSQRHPDVPPLDIQSDFGSRRSSLKLVLFSFLHTCAHVNIVVYTGGSIWGNPPFSSPTLPFTFPLLPLPPLRNRSLKAIYRGSG